MSEVPGGPGWWQASDGRWYPPQPPPPPPPTMGEPNPYDTAGSATYGSAPPAYGSAPPAYGSAPSPYGSASNPYGSANAVPGLPASFPPGTPPPPAPPPAYGSWPPGPGQMPPPGYGYGYASPMTPVKTNGFAIASLVCSCAGIFFFGLAAILGIVFGFVARSQIAASQGQERGRGLATAGIIVGFVLLAVGILLIVTLVVTGGSATTSFNRG